MQWGKSHEFLTLQLFNSTDNHIDLFMKVAILLPVTGQQATRENITQVAKEAENESDVSNIISITRQLSEFAR